jgi:hypothetical protein
VLLAVIAHCPSCDAVILAAQSAQLAQRAVLLGAEPQHASPGIICVGDADGSVARRWDLVPAPAVVVLDQHGHPLLEPVTGPAATLATLTWLAKLPVG